MNIGLHGPADVEGFKRSVRWLLAQAIAPAEVVWSVAGGPPSLWAEPPLFIGDEPVETVRVPAFLVTLCETALLHREPQRFDLLYRLLWRVVHEPGLRDDVLDADRCRAEQWAREVHRDLHKMRAFVRFTPVGDGEALRHIAWFEPQHHIVEANAPFFQRRFAQLRWVILTPQRCVEWDGRQLLLRPGADRSAAPPPDAGAQLWLTYYEHIFNPARLKLATMAKEMPRRYWRNLPEAALIEPLAAAAQARSDAMVAAGPTPQRRIKPISRPS